MMAERSPWPLPDMSFVPSGEKLSVLTTEVWLLSSATISPLAKS
jgi:hypothetical protein